MSLLRFFPKVSKNNESNASSSSNPEVQIDWEKVHFDLGKRSPIFEFHLNLHDSIGRALLLRGPTQPIKEDYPPLLIGNRERSFCKSWYKNNLNWLEYSEKNNSVHCLPCYLFKNESESSQDSFSTKVGFIYFNKKERLKTHIGEVNSCHNIDVRKCEDLMNQKQGIESSFKKQSHEEKTNYLLRIKASLSVTRFLLLRGLAFRGHDESPDSSSYKGNFLELLEFWSSNNEEIAKVVLDNAPKNHKMTSPDIQKEFVNARAVETILKIVKEIGDETFSVLVDESGDCAKKEQMAIVLRFVDDRGSVVERFVGIVHVKETSSISLKNVLENFLCGYKLSLSRIRGHGYDGASNMRSRLGGLKTLIQQDNPNVYYIHCFAHQLQLALIVVVKEHADAKCFFGVVTRVVNVIGSSNKRQDLLRDHQASHVENLIGGGLLETGRGLNQERSLARVGDTHWGSHFRTLTSLLNLFTPVIEVLEELEVDGSSDKDG